jgi:hypothetical protein
MCACLRVPLQINYDTTVITAVKAHHEVEYAADGMAVSGPQVGAFPSVLFLFVSTMRWFMV